jgi:GT2 family glycosyltransferase
VPKVSIHIVTYNSAATIAPCLESLQRQRFTDFSTLVMDNASTDDTVEQVKAMGFEVIANPRNVGYAVAHNHAIGQTQSDYVLTLNPDVWLDPDFLTHMVRALDASPQHGSAAGRLLRVDHLGDTPDLIDSTGLVMSRSRRQRLRHDGLSLERAPTHPSLIFGPDGAAAFYRRAMLEDIAINGEVFDSDFFMHKEDIDLCWRAQLRGWSSVYVPEAVGHHVRGFRPGQRGRVSADMRFYAVRNRYLLMLKNDAPAHFWRDFWAIALYDLRILVYILLRERESWRAFPAAWDMRRPVLAKRKIIQARRKVEWRSLRRWFRRGR